jgi:hypothetical protein
VISKEQIDAYIQSIPTSPKDITDAIKALEAKDILGAAVILGRLPAVTVYLQNMSQKGIQTLQEKTPQISTILAFFGSKKSKAMLYTYLISLTLPKKWKVFDFDNELFFSLNSELLYYWEKILKAKAPDKIERYISATPLITASVAICDVIFADAKDNIKALRELGHLDLNDLLLRISGSSIFDIAKLLGAKLGFDNEVITIVGLAQDCKHVESHPEHAELARYLHLLLFYILSRAVYMKSGLNGFIQFQAMEVTDILDDFQDIVGECKL